MFQFQLLPSLSDLTHMLCRKKIGVRQEAPQPSTCGQRSWAGATFRTCSRFSSLARSLWFSSRTELCWAVTSERSSLSSSFSDRVWRNHNSRENNKVYELSCVWWRQMRSSTPTWSSSCAFLLRSSASSFNCSFLLRSSSSWLSCFPKPKDIGQVKQRIFSLLSESLLQPVTVILILTETMAENMREIRKMAH